MERVAKDLKIWSTTLFSDAKVQFHIVNELIFRFDIAMEHRQLTPAEFSLRKLLKQRIIGLAVIERARRRQSSRITWLKSGDANTAFFNAKIHSRRRKNFIHSLRTEGRYVTQHHDKAAVIHEHFDRILGTKETRACTINWAELQMPTVTGGGLDNPFSEAEVWKAILASPAEKAPGPDGFNGIFFRKCWDIIKDDIMAIFHQFHSLSGSNLSAINTALVALLPKKDGAEAMGDFRPIGLINSVVKLIAKVLSMRLSEQIGTLILPAQSAFLKTRCLQDNFLYVQNCVRSLHRKKKPTLLIKLDIAQAIDSVSWEYILELLRTMGFSARWRDWMAMLLVSQSSAFVLNGTPGAAVNHCKGL